MAEAQNVNVGLPLLHRHPVRALTVQARYRGKRDNEEVIFVQPNVSSSILSLLFCYYCE